MKHTIMHVVQIITAFVLCEVSVVLAQNEGQVRLAGSFPADIFQGRVEVYHSGRWGTICHDMWDMTDARVICRQLSFKMATAAPGSAFFGMADESMPIFLNNVDCHGDEYQVGDCDRSSWNNNNCSHGEDAGVICANYGEEGEVRLVAGSNYNTGRVEIYHNSSWGTICNDDWDLDDAKVVCRELGFGAATEAGSSSLLGAGVGDVQQPIYLSYVGCDGTEAYLADCRNGSWGNHTCQHADDAGVICGEEEGEEGDLRLRDGLTDLEGRLEIFNDDRWGNIVAGSWNIRDATVACHQMGFTDAASAIFGYFKHGRLDQPCYTVFSKCRGNETMLADCFVLHDDKCPKLDYHVGIVCLNEVNEGDLRLTDLFSPSMGRLEIHHDGEWGTICANDNWYAAELKVACRQLGYDDYSPMITYEPGWGPIFLSDVDCRGNEMSIVDCHHAEWEENECGHDDDIAVACLPPTTGSSGHKNSALLTTLAILGVSVIVVIA